MLPLPVPLIPASLFNPRRPPSVDSKHHRKLNLAFGLDGGQKKNVSEFHPSQRLLPAEQINYAVEASMVQRRAALGQPSAIRIGSIVLFSTVTRDAWMIEVQTGEAACLARAGESRPIPITETPGKLDIAWEARHRWDNEDFTVIENDRPPETLPGYPVAQIRQLITDYPEEFAAKIAGGIVAARERKSQTGRNAPCPCGSGRKYKKCCLPLDESAAGKASQSVQRSELTGMPIFPKPAHADEENHADELDDADEETDADEENDADELDDLFGFTNEADPMADEPELDPEVTAAADRIWNDFERIPQPTPAQLDALLDQLLALPMEVTEWPEVMDLLVRAHHPDLTAAFRRIDRVMPPRKAAGPSYFYWNAIEKFVTRGQDEIIPEIARGFRRLDRESYDADSLKFLLFWMMAAGCDADALALEEHFLPIMRADNQLMPHAVPSSCRSIFELRVGLRLREIGSPEGELETLARELRHDLDEEVHPDFARRAAQLIRGEAPPEEIRQEDFNLPHETVQVGQPSWQNALRQFEILMLVAHEAWKTDGRSPGCAFRGLWLLVNAVYNEDGQQDWSPKKNLLDCLQPRGMERRIARSTQDLLGTNTPHAHLLIEAHADLLRFAARHRLIAESKEAKSATNIATLRNKLGFSASRAKANSDRNEQNETLLDS